MTNFTFFRTYFDNSGEVMVKDFETETAARENALADTEGTNFHLYKVTMTINGQITYTKQHIERIACGKEIAREEKYLKASEIDKKRYFIYAPITNWTGRMQ